MKISKWQTWAHVGLYPRHSPMHAKTVVLVLNLTTGLVSPQFHIKYDDFFETVNNSEFNLPIEWKTKCHFVKVPIKPQEYPIEELTSLIEIVDGSIQENADQQIPLELIPNTVLESHQGRENGQEMQTYPTPLESMSVQSPENQPQQIKWSQRHKPSTQLLESREQAGLVFSSIFDDADGDEEIWLQINIAHPIAYAVSTDPDTMYMEQAMLQPDRKQFLKAMADEVNAHTQNGHWRLILRSEVPPGIKVLPSVWAMKCKGQIATREAYKWKARLNLHGGKHEYGVNYWEKYAATLAWPPIHFLMTLSIIKSWHTWQIDFTLAYPQADVECDMHMDIPRGFQVGNGNN